jgi:hypothetical protein
MKNKISYGLIILRIMSVLLPIWLTIGKSMIFGVGGWMSLVYMFTIAPAIFVIFWIFYTFIALRKDVIELRSIGLIDSVILAGLYVSIFLHGFFLVDGGDTKESVNSVASKHFGLTHEMSSEYSGLLMAIAFALFVAGFIVFIYELIKKRAIRADNLI